MKHNILLADNELSNLKALERTLRDEYNVFSTTSGTKALIVMERNDVPLIIVNYHMPDMADEELLKQVRQKDPDIICIILAAYSDENLLTEAINEGRVYGYVTKPWEPEEVKAIVMEALQTYEIASTSRELHIRALLHTGLITREQLESALRFQKNEEKTLEEVLVKHCMITKSKLNLALKLQESEQKELEEILIEHGDISHDDLRVARELQKHDKKGLSAILVDLGYVDEDSIYSCYALSLGVPYITLSQFSNNLEIAHLLPLELAYKYRAVPVDVMGQVLTLASSEPLSVMAKNRIEMETGYKVMMVCSPYNEIEAVLEQYCDLEQNSNPSQKTAGSGINVRTKEEPVIEKKLDRAQGRIAGEKVEINLGGFIQLRQTNDTMECIVKEISQDCTELILIVTDQRICDLEDIDLHIFMPVENSPVKCAGRITWCSEGEESISAGTYYLVRVSIVQISRMDKRRLDLIIAQKRAFIGAG